MLSVERLTKRYGALTAIQNLTFNLCPGEALGLLGPNGSGKSTTVKILTGLLKPTSGNVRIDGRDALADLPRYKADIGYVPEEPHLYTYLTGPEYLRLIGRLRRVPESALEAKIERFFQLLAGNGESLLFWPAATALVLNVAGRRAALAWSADATDGDDGDHEAITMLAIAQSGDLVLG